MSAPSRRFFARPWLAIFLAVLVWPSRTCVAQGPASGAEQGENLTVYRLAVSPAAEPRPALRYRFLVPPVDQIHANAATFYYKAMVTDPPGWVDRFAKDEAMQAWNEMPVAELPIDEMKKKLRMAEAKDEDFNISLRAAARSDSCNWEDPIREYGIETRLPQAQQLRQLARVLAPLARLQIAEHRHGDAIDTLRLGYALSRHLGQAPTLVQNLIGIAIGTFLNNQTRALIADSDSPNLYWALTELASHPTELRQSLSYESQFWESTLHKLRDLDQRTLSPREALDLTKKLHAYGIMVSNDRQRPAGDLAQEFAAVSAAVAIEPAARAYLSEQGFSAATIDEMPLLQRALLYRWRQFAEVRDNVFKWSLLPDDENGGRNFHSEIQDLQVSRSDVGAPFLDALPSIAQAYRARLRHQRELNLLRTVEALRMHAAQHGIWPQSLADVTVVPIPLDPVTEKPFEYSLAAGIATLRCPPTKNQSAYGPAVRYELTLRKSTQTN